MLFSIDRIESSFAVLVDENGETVTVNADQLPDGVREGDMVKKTDAGFFAAPEETELRRQQVLALQNRLRKK